MPEISVIVPVYKVEKYLNRCVDSILAQTFTDFELILVDDGSPDNCPQICDDYAQKDSRVHVIHKQNGGLSDARNFGIDWAFENSNSEWITFIDSDDWVHRKYLEALYNAVMGTGLKISSLLFKRTSVFDPRDVCADVDIRYSAEKSEDVYTHFGKTVWAYAWGRLFHKSCFGNIRFPKGKYWEDVATTYKLFIKFEQLAYIPCELYFYCDNGNGIVRNMWNRQRFDEIEFFEAMLEDENVRKKWKSVIPIIQRMAVSDLCADFYYMNINLTDEEEKKYCMNVVSQKARKAIKKYKKSLGLSFGKNKALYEAAYPKLMGYYWALESRISKLKRK